VKKKKKKKDCLSDPGATFLTFESGDLTGSWLSVHAFVDPDTCDTTVVQDKPDGLDATELSDRSQRAPTTLSPVHHHLFTAANLTCYIFGA